MGQFNRGKINLIFQGHWQISLAKSIVQIWSLAVAILRLQFSTAHQYMATSNTWLYPISAKYLCIRVTTDFYTGLKHHLECLAERGALHYLQASGLCR